MANTYNYYEAVKEDVKDYIENEINLEEYRGNRDRLEEELNDDLWTADQVTGNASGSYTFNTYEAEENLCHNMDLLEEIADEWGIEPTIKAGYEHGAEWWDVTIRCYYLGQAIAEVLDDLEAAGELDEEEADEE